MKNDTFFTGTQQKQGIPETRLQLLLRVSGVFSPGVLTTLL